MAGGVITLKFNNDHLAEAQRLKSSSLEQFFMFRFKVLQVVISTGAVLFFVGLIIGGFSW